MAEYSRLFGGPVGSVPEYNQNDLSDVLKRIFGNGVFKEVDNELEVVDTDPVSLAVKIKTGEGWINGFWYQNTAELTKSLSAADGSNPRIDRIVLRLDTVTNFKISVEVLEGTPAGSPAAPSLTQTSSIYEIALAQVYVDTSVTSVSDSDITDERSFAKLSTYIPTGDYEAAPKKYVDDNFLSYEATSVASNSTPNPTGGSVRNLYTLTALAANATFAAPSGSPSHGNMLFVIVKDNGTSRDLAYNAIYDDPYSAELPDATTVGKTLLMLFMYNSASSKWELLNTDEEA